MRVAIGKGIEWASLKGHDSGTKGIKCSSAQGGSWLGSLWPSERVMNPMMRGQSANGADDANDKNSEFGSLLWNKN
jgi:hypothetical protein